MKFLFDTNILLHYLRNDAVSARTDALFSPLSIDNQPIISIASIGEIYSIAIQREWKANKLLLLQNLLQKLIITDIKSDPMVRRYAEIDAFSQNKLPGKPLGLTSRNMGKNDLWIAATASLLGAKLLTTDRDFDHLNGIFLDLEKIPFNKP